MRTSIFALPWRVFDRGESDGRCGAYAIAEFPSIIGLARGMTIAVGYPRASDASIYAPALGVGGVPEGEIRRAFRLMARSVDHALVLERMIRGELRVEFAQGVAPWPGARCEVCFDGMRHSTMTDEFGCPMLTDFLRGLLLEGSAFDQSQHPAAGPGAGPAAAKAYAGGADATGTNLDTTG